MKSETNLFIAGAWTPAANEAVFENLNPATEEVWASVADADASDADRAIDAAAEAQPAWEALGSTGRAEVLMRVSAAIDEHRDELVDGLIAEVGSVRMKAGAETFASAGYIAAAIDAAATIEPVELPSNMGKRNLIVRKPVGVVSVISPWNVPLALSMRAISYALALGNTVVVKPSEESPVSGGLAIARLFEAAGAPPGVLNVVTCSRDNVGSVGNRLVDHPAVGAISFTGSERVGRLLAAQAGQQLKKIDLELGGSDAQIILADADLDGAVDAATFGAFNHAGQICMSTKRIVVEEPVADEFIARFAERAGGLAYGSPYEATTVVGPIINRGQLDQLQAAVDDAQAKGARVLVGGTSEGTCFPPTVLVDVTPEMIAYGTELFGPVRVVHVAADSEDALRIANDSKYGLSGSIWTADIDRGLAMADRFETGMVHINGTTLAAEPHVPFGGIKASGMGRHCGEGSIEAFTETRWHSVQTSPGQVPPPFAAKTSPEPGQES